MVHTVIYLQCPIIAGKAEVWEDLMLPIQDSEVEWEARKAGLTGAKVNIAVI
jgi:hypothetical protein